MRGAAVAGARRGGGGGAGRPAARSPGLVLGWISADFLQAWPHFGALNFFEIYKKIIFSRAKFANFCQNFGKICEIMFENCFAKICKICRRERDFLGGLEKC